MNNQSKFNFLSQFNFNNENDLMKSFENSETTFGDLCSNGEDCWNHIINYFNENDICIDICIEFAENIDEWENLEDELFNNSTKLWMSDDEFLEVYSHPIMGNYIAINGDNPGYIFTINKSRKIQHLQCCV